MRKLFCRLTGGHRFDEVRVERDIKRGIRIITNTCHKCGKSFQRIMPDERENNNLYCERRLSGMKEFIAKNPKQLDICLRLLYAEKVHFNVAVKETVKHKIVYEIRICTDAQTRDSLMEKYRILTS